MRRAVDRLLKVSGYTTQSFSSTADAGLTECLSRAYCVVADVQLPGSSSPLFFATFAAPRPPVVFVTAYDSEETRVAINRAGGGELLTKPFLGTDLLSAIKRAARSS